MSPGDEPMWAVGAIRTPRWSIAVGTAAVAIGTGGLIAGEHRSSQVWYFSALVLGIVALVAVMTSMLDPPPSARRIGAAIRMTVIAEELEKSIAQRDTRARSDRVLRADTASSPEPSDVARLLSDAREALDRAESSGTATREHRAEYRRLFTVVTRAELVRDLGKPEQTSQP